MTSITGFVEQEREFWDGETPTTGDLRRWLNRKMKSRRLLVPPRKGNPRRAGLLATAASFFSGLLAGGSIVHVLRWIRKLDEYLYFAGKHHVDVDLVGCFMRIFNVLIGGLDQKKGVKTWRNRELLARVLLYISEAETASRSKRPERFPSVEGIPENPSLEGFRRWIEGKTDESMVEECLELASALQEITPTHGTDIRHNPVFGEFGVIEEAEGDLYVDCALYKIETADSFKDTTVRQLIGCCVMNRLNEVMPSIKRIGLINPRRGFRWEEEVNEVCLMVGTGGISELTRNMARKLLELASPEQRLVTMDHVG